jgi:hypothetical protein
MRSVRWIRAPLVHFLAGGALLFRVVYGPAPFVAAGHGTTPAIVVSADDVARLRAGYARETGLEPTPDDEVAIIDRAIDEELLFREALERGLDRNDRSVRTWLVEQMDALSDTHGGDPETLYRQARALGLDRSDLVVRRILVQKMRLLASRIDERDPGDDVLRAFHAVHRNEYVPPARISLWHVFVATATHGDAAPRVAGELLDTFGRARRLPEDAVRAGDAFPVPPHLVGQSPAQLEKLFGPEFAARVERGELGRWIGPVPSAYGVHLVWIDGREPGTAPPFEAVRDRVRERWQNEQRARRIERLIRDLKARIPLEIESAAWRSRGPS